MHRGLKAKSLRLSWLWDDDSFQREELSCVHAQLSEHQSCKLQPQSILTLTCKQSVGLQGEQNENIMSFKLKPQTLNYTPPAFHKQDCAVLAYFEI